MSSGTGTGGLASSSGKRKKSSFDDSSDEGGGGGGGSGGRKRSKKYDLTEQLQELMDSLRNYKAPGTGRVLCEAFIRAPKRRNLAEYYDVVASPIDLLRIQQKIRMDEYDDLEQFSADVELLVGNAKAYYKADSAEYADADQLWEVFTELRDDIFGEGGTGGSGDGIVGAGGDGSSDARTLDSGDDDAISNLDAQMPSGGLQIGNIAGAGGSTGGGLDSMSNSESEGGGCDGSTGSNGGHDSHFEELFSSVMMATSDDGRQLSTMFELLPSKAAYPDYYEVVAEPIDLKTIASRIQAADTYSTLADLEKDLLLMITNAKKYNAPGSQIYKDANSLRKIVTTKRAEIELRKSQPAKSSERIRAKRNNPYQPKWSAITASLKYEEDDEAAAATAAAAAAAAAAGGETSMIGGDYGEDTVNFSDSEDSESNPQWLLYNAVKDTPYSEPFFRLPSRRHYPDYYREIKQPISLAQICSRIKSGYYDSVSRLTAELTLVFENAMAYNRPDSKLFKDAAKLKKILQIKSKEIITVFKEDGGGSGGGATSGEADDEEDEEEEEEDDDDDGEEGKERKASGRGSSKWNTSSSSSRVVARAHHHRNTSSTSSTRKSSKSMVQSMSAELKNVRRVQKAGDSAGPLKKRLRALYRALLDARDEEERYLIDPFMDKPSKKLYPDYYEIIAAPIDMKTIDGNIKNDVYQSVEELLADFRLMFENCRKYNEDGSQIYQDAGVLERLLRTKLAELGPVAASNAERSKGRERVRPSSGNQLKMKTLFETVRDYKDSKGRYLSPIFMKLPSRADFPDYYDVIRKPICLEKIGTRVKNCIYETVEDLLGDIILMLDNACKYNEPDSQVFKDALTLQQVALQTKIDLNEDSVNGIPDVKIIVQDLLTNLFISVYNHQDEEGRCFSDSINELTELGDRSSEVELRTLNFDIIKKNLNAGRYRRLDRFQQDMFEVFERARLISRTDSQAFEDAIELQQYFISLRNDLCKGGQVLQSSALHYDLGALNEHIEALRKEKLPREATEEAEAAVKAEQEAASTSTALLGTTSNTSAQAQPIATMVDGDETTVMVNEVVYKVGDFVYVTPNAGAAEPHIINIEKFIRDPAGSGQLLLHGCWFYRPAETFHIPTRRFMEKEIFKTDNYTSTPLSNVSGKCCVMFVKDYFRSRPLNFEDADVYVCESRYSCKSKSFKKIKVWTYDVLSNVAIVPREVPLPMNRVPSVFKDQGMATGLGSAEVKTLEEELVGMDGDVKEGVEGGVAENVDDKGVLDVPRPNVLCASPEGLQTPDGWTYYEQFSIPAGTFRVGDCCYVRTDQERNLICRIDRMWTDEAGNPYFHGPWFVQQAELPPNTVGSFYPQEVFLSSIEDTNPLLSICERCAVLSVTDYIMKRPTEFLEKDVYVCEIRYLEHEKRFEALPPEGLAKFVRQNYGVVEDEMYFFRRPLMLQKDSYVMPQVVEASAQVEQQQAMFNGSQQMMVVDGGGGGAQMGRPSLDVDMTDESNMSAISATGAAVLPQQHLQQIPMQMIQQQQLQLQQQQQQQQAQLQLQAQAQAQVQAQQQQQMMLDPSTGMMVPVMAAAGVQPGGGVQIVQAAPTTPAAGAAAVAAAVASAPTPTVLPPTPATPVTSAAVAALKKPKTPKRLVTGYIIFASEVRKSVVEANPDCSFGDISRIIGSQWKILTQEQKGEYEQRAAKQNAEVKEAAAAESALMEQLGVNPASPAVGNESIPNGVFECHWEHKCDFQFEDVNDLYEHLTAEPNGHVWTSYAETKDKEPGEFQCMFHGCGRVRKGAPPFPTVTRLVRHCKEVHIQKAVAKVIDPEKRSKNYVPSSKGKPAVDVQQQQQQQQQQLQQQQQQQQQVQLQQQQQQQSMGMPTQLTFQTAQGLQMVQTTGGQAHHPPGTTQTIQIPASALHHHQQGQIQTIQIRDPTSGNIQTAIVTTGPPPHGMGGGPGVGPQTFQLATTGAHHPHIIGTTTINGQTIQIAAAPHPNQQQQIQQGQQQQQQQTMMVPTSGGGVQQVHFTTTTAQQPQQTTQQQQTQQTPQQQQQQQAQIQAQIQAQVQQQIQAQLQQQAQQQQQIVKPQTANQAVQVKPVEPLFSAPPAPKRLVHTHTYMKYIESLKPDRRYLSNWERQLSASPATCNFNAALLANVASGKVNGAKKSVPGAAVVSSSSATSSSSANPVTWLENGANGHSSVVDALWTLRDFMMKDALSLATI